MGVFYQVIVLYINDDFELSYRCHVLHRQFVHYLPKP